MSPVPTMQGLIERRLLVNYRVVPDVLERLLPSPFRPQLVEGYGMAGICLIRLGDLRPGGLPASLGLTTENAAHRVAVEWDGPEGPCHGVYVPRRDTSSRLTAVVGGRLFPGEHHRARFRIRESDRHYEVAFASLDGVARAAVSAEVVSELPGGSVFGTLAAASAFFQGAPLGYSATRRHDRYDGLELSCELWRVEPLQVNHAESRFFEDRSLFPVGTAELDSALLMRDIPATWTARAPLPSAHAAAASPHVPV